MNVKSIAGYIPKINYFPTKAFFGITGDLVRVRVWKEFNPDVFLLSQLKKQKLLKKFSFDQTTIPLLHFNKLQRKKVLGIPDGMPLFFKKGLVLFPPKSLLQYWN